MSSTDNRIVRMVFDNAAFKKAASDTKTSLDAVNTAVDKAGKNKGLLDLESSMQHVTLHAGKMQIAMVTAISTITNKLVNIGLAMGKSILLDPIKQGFNEYESLLTKQNVIMNATKMSAEDVKAGLNELNTYSDKTIYSFGNMTDSVMKFVNSGVKLPEAIQAIEGISNAAALAGATAEESGRAMYNFAQALSTGSVKLIDWKSIEMANMGTQDFKQHIMDTAVAMHTLIKTSTGYVTVNGKAAVSTKNFQSTLAKGWFTADVLTSTLKKYSDTTTKFGQKAFLEATKVRTFTAFMSTLKESLGSGWAQVFTGLFGGLDEATNMWTSLALGITGVTGAFFTFVSATLEVWRTLGGASKVAQGFKNILSPIGALFKAIGDAWHAAFGKEGGKGAGSTLYALSYSFELLTRPLTWLAKLISFLVYPLRVFFEIIYIGGKAIGAVIGFVVDFVKAFLGLATFNMPAGGGGIGSFLTFIKDFVVEVVRCVDAITDLLKKGKSLKEAFNGVTFHMPKFPGFPELPSWLGGKGGAGISMPKISFPGMDKLPSLGNIFGGGGDDPAKQASGITTMSTAVMGLVSNITDLDSTTGIQTLGTNVRQLEGSQKVADKFGTNLRELESSATDLAATYGVNIRELESPTAKFGETLTTVKDKGRSFMDVLRGIGSKIASFFGLIKGEDLIKSMNFAILATMGVTFGKVMYNISHLLSGFGNTGKNFNNVLKSASNAMGSFQTQARAKLILNIALAIGILAVSLLLLSLIPRDKMVTALMGLAGAIAALGAILFIFSKTVEKMGDKVTLKLYALSFAMVAIGLAMLLIVSAMLLMRFVKTEDVLKTLVTLAVLFKGLETIGNTAEKSARKILAAGASMILIGGALIILATAMLMFKLVKPDDMIKAGLVVAVLVQSLLLLSQVPVKSLAKAGTTFLAIAISMLILAKALMMFGNVDWQSIVKAGVVLAGLVLAIALMDAEGPGGAAMMVAMGIGLLLIANACLAFNQVSWEAIAMAGVVLLGLVIAFGLMLALMTIFAPAVAMLTALAWSLAALALAGTLLTLAIAVILPLLAAGIALFGAFATAAAVAIAVFLQTLATEMPTIVEAIGKIIDGLIKIVVDATPKLLKALLDIIHAIIDKADDFSEAGVELIVALIEGLIRSIGKIVAAAVRLVLALVNGIADQEQKITKAAINLILKFIAGIASMALQLATGGIKLIVDFLHGLATAIRSGSGALGEAVGDVVNAFVEMGPKFVAGLVKGIAEAPLGALENAIGAVVKHIPGAAKISGLIHSPSRLMIPIGKFMVDGLVVGIQNNAAAAITAVASVVGGQIAIAEEYISAFVQRLEQQSIAARAKAEGLANAAERAAKSAAKTEKNKKDDASAAKLQAEADAASKKADTFDEKVTRAKDAANRQAEYNAADTLARARMRSEDAAKALDDAKAAELKATQAIIAAKALEKQARSGVYSTAEVTKLLKQATQLRLQAQTQAKLSNTYLDAARTAASQALALQQQAGAEAALAFQTQFDAEAKSAADQDIFDAMNDADKAIARRLAAAQLEKDAAANLAKAKILAYSDVEAANSLAQIAMDQAEKARQYLKDAVGYEEAVAKAAADVAQAAADKAAQDAAGQSTVTPTVDLTASDAAALAFANMADLFDSATAAAAAVSTVQFNQYNSSPEALSPTEVYRQTNNLLTHATERLGQAA